MIPDDNSTVLVPANFAQGFTQSELGTLDDCGEKWYLGYNHMLRKKGAFEWYFVYGDAAHRSLSEWYLSGCEEVASLQFPPDVFLDNTQEAERDKWQAILQVQLERYYKYYANDRDEMTPIINEEIVSVEFEGLKFTGKIDLLAGINGEPDAMMDHKFVGRFDPTATLGWDFRFQFMFYLWMVQKATGRKIERFMPNAVRKPALKQGKEESLQTYISRVRQDMIQRPAEYFKREPLAMLQTSMDHFEDRVLRPKIERLRLLTEATTPASIIEALFRNQNTSNCVKYGKACQFLPICQHGWKREKLGYVIRENKHEELEAE